MTTEKIVSLPQGHALTFALTTYRRKTTPTEIEWLMKDFKAHRCALNFDRGFVSDELKVTKRS
jgi:hypothetical protein